MITVKCITELCENKDIAIELDVPSDGLVICGPCGATLNGVTPQRPETTETSQ